MSGAERLAAGEAYVDLSGWRKVTVTGPDAARWLNDLISADIEDLEPGRSKRTLLLGPTGGVLASFTVSAQDHGFLLVQDPAEPRPVDRLLAPYVLSSEVAITDRTDELTIFAFPGRHEVPDATGATACAPSALGAGADLVATADARDRLSATLAERFTAADEHDADAWRAWAGIPRIGHDTADGDLPQECGLDDLVAFEKGCFLGQEAVARSRNLGHPRRLLLAFESEGPLTAGEEVLAGDRPAGVLTSVARMDGRTFALARIGWAHRDRALRSVGGASLEPRSVTA